MRPTLAMTALALIGCNQAPEGLQVSLGPDGARTADDLVLEVVQAAVDPNSGDEVTLEVRWTLDGDAVSELDDAMTVPSARTARAQMWEATVVATDGVKRSEAEVVSLEVANTPPSVTLTLDPTSPTSADDVVASVVTDDADGDEVTVAFEWYEDGEGTAESGDTLDASATTAGSTWTAVAIPSDQDGPGEDDAVEFTIGNSAPSVGAARVAPTRIFETTTLTCEGAGWSDADDDPPTYRYRWLVDGSTVSTAASLTGEDFDRDQTVSCELTPIDAVSEGSPVVSAGALVRNSLPILTSGELVPEDPTTNSVLEGKAGPIIDDDGDTAVVRYAWQVNGVDLMRPASYLDGSSGAFVKGDTVTAFMVAYDGTDYGPRLEFEVEIGNTPPTAPTVAIEVNEDLLCRITTPAADDDDDALTYSATWTVDGVAFTGSLTNIHSGDSVSLDEVDSGEDWRCTMVADDGDDTGPGGTDTYTAE